MCVSVQWIGTGTLSHQAICREHHLLCTLQFTGISSTGGQMRWCTKIHLFETIWKWQLYCRNIEIKMKQNIIDDACIVDFFLCTEEHYNAFFFFPCQESNNLSFIFQVWIPLEIWLLQDNMAFKMMIRRRFPVNSVDFMNKEENTTNIRKLPRVSKFILLVIAHGDSLYSGHHGIPDTWPFSANCPLSWEMYICVFLVSASFKCNRSLLSKARGATSCWGEINVTFQCAPMQEGRSSNGERHVCKVTL